MTIVGKILVFLNLVFSLLVGALVIFAYTTRTNWYDYAQKAETKQKATEGVSKQIVKEKREVEQERDAVYEKYADLRQNYDSELQTLRDENAKLKKDYDALDTKVKISNLNVKTQQVVGTVRDNEVKSLVKLVDDQKKAIADLEIERDKLTDDNKTLDLQKNIAAARAAALQQQLKEAVLDLAKAQERANKVKVQPTERASSDDNPPPGRLEGRVLSVDPTGSTITISLGIDQGLEEDHTLEVFRLGPKPKYLGKVRVVRVTTRGSTARRIQGRNSLPRTDMIQPGDRVASRIKVGG